MNAFRPGGGLIGATGLAIALVLAVSLWSPTAAQTPQGMNCAPPLRTSGGNETVASGLMVVYLPPPYHYVMNVPAQGSMGGTLRICVIDYFSQIEFSTDTGKEIGRVVGIPVASTLLDAIASGARSIIPPTPTPVPPTAVQSGQANGGSGGSRTFCSSSICPPNTGDAGLR